jgi:nucleotidyltransferase substrate binding protein (TIGR01987 family)
MALDLSYELAFKFLKRQLEQMSPVPSNIDELTFGQVLRSAAEAGLIADVQRFREDREARNITSHSYNREG